MSSRTSLRLQLMREQSMQQDQQQISASSGNQAQQGNPVAIRVTSGLGATAVPGSSLPNKTSPIIIQQPIRFTGKQLVHLPPQIFHVQSQGDDDKKSLSGSAPNNVGYATSSNDFSGTPPKVVKQDGMGTPQQGSRNSPAELSPPGYADSPHSQHSASFTSAQSEIDDIHIIDEILSLEDDQLRRQQRTAELASSYTYANDLSTSVSSSRPVSIAGGHAVAYTRQVSNSAPSSSVDIESLVKQEILREQELQRDRRKKDIHNMIERRRRYNINDRIKELGMILPKMASDDLKMNKGTILKASVDYIRQLQRERDGMIRIQQRQSVLEHQNRTMHQRIKELERHLQSHGVPLPSSSNLPVVLEQQQTAVCSPVATSSPVSEQVAMRPIKQEPLDEAGTASSSGSHQASSSFQTNISQEGEQCFKPPPPQHAAPSPSFTTMVEFSNLALDSHGYAAAPVGIVSGDGGQSKSVASLFGGVPNDTLETPPVLPPASASQPPSFPSQQMTELTTSSLLRASELMMEDGTQSSSPMLRAGDPMLSAGGSGVVPQLSPVQWDSATFSPDRGTTEQKMDMTS